MRRFRIYILTALVLPLVYLLAAREANAQTMTNKAIHTHSPSTGSTVSDAQISRFASDSGPSFTVNYDWVIEGHGRTLAYKKADSAAVIFDKGSALRVLKEGQQSEFVNKIIREIETGESQKWIWNQLPSQAPSPVRWQTYQTKYNNVIFTAREEGNNIVFGIEGTDPKKVSFTVLKSTLMKTTTVRDTIKVVLDVTKSAEFIAVTQTLAQKIQENESLKANLDRAISEAHELRIQKDQYLQSLRAYEAERKRYKGVWILMDTSMLRKP